MASLGGMLFNQALRSQLDSYPSNWWQSTFNPTKAEYNINSAMLAREMDFNAQQAQIQRDWEEKMSNTAYQRAVEDMRSAGLNPYLAYSQGGASTPQGSVASINSPTISARANSENFLRLVNSAISLASSIMTKNSAKLMANTKMKIAQLGSYGGYKQR